MLAARPEHNGERRRRAKGRKEGARGGWRAEGGGGQDGGKRKSGVVTLRIEFRIAVAGGFLRSRRDARYFKDQQ